MLVTLTTPDGLGTFIFHRDLFLFAEQLPDEQTVLYLSDGVTGEPFTVPVYEDIETVLALLELADGSDEWVIEEADEEVEEGV